MTRGGWGGGSGWGGGGGEREEALAALLEGGSGGLRRVGGRCEGEGLRSGWGRVPLAGRLVELSGSGASAVLTAACALVLEVQLAREPVAWVSAGEGVLYAPDLERAGVDLGALPLVRVEGLLAALRAGEQLLRSGAFGLVVLDVGEVLSARGLGEGLGGARGGRLARLAQQHGSTVLCVTRKARAEGSLGSLVSLRVEARRERLSGGRFVCHVEALKDKRCGPGWRHEQVCCGPLGLR